MRRVYLLALAGLLPCVVRAQDSEAQHKPVLSPDKQWEYLVADGAALLVRAGDDKPVINLSDVGEVTKTETGKLVWAPDSKRFALNYRAGGKSYSFDLYELEGATWRKLPDIEDVVAPVNQMIQRSQRQQLKRLGAKKDANPNSVMETWRVLRWLKNDTFQALGNSEKSVIISKTSDDPEYYGAAVLFTGKCDSRGGWKVVYDKLLSDAEVEKIGVN
ncbi:MAG: hypothetical protein M3N12_08315 [Verrucomicrobiota bacterium]|nr:hypothetical protein [Verrucomicrobiota bacterium]